MEDQKTEVKEKIDDFNYESMNLVERSVVDYKSMYKKLINFAGVLIIILIGFIVYNSINYKDRFYILKNGDIKRVSDPIYISEIYAEHYLKNLLEVNPYTAKTKITNAWKLSEGKARAYITELLNKRYVNITVDNSINRYFKIIEITTTYEDNLIIHNIIGEQNNVNSFGTENKTYEILLKSFAVPISKENKFGLKTTDINMNATKLKVIDEK